jgi:hypothetical protein
MENKLECKCEWCESPKDIFMYKLIESMYKYLICIKVLLTSVFILLEGIKFLYDKFLYNKIKNKIQKEIKKLELNILVARKSKFYFIKFTYILVKLTCIIILIISMFIFIISILFVYIS